MPGDEDISKNPAKQSKNISIDVTMELATRSGEMGKNQLGKSPPATDDSKQTPASHDSVTVESGKTDVMKESKTESASLPSHSKKSKKKTKPQTFEPATEEPKELHEANKTTSVPTVTTEKALRTDVPETVEITLSREHIKTGKLDNVPMVTTETGEKKQPTKPEPTSKKLNQSKKVSDERLGDSLDTSTRTSDSNEQSDSASKNIIEITAVIGELSSDTSSASKSPVIKDPCTSDAIPEVKKIKTGKLDNVPLVTTETGKKKQPTKPEPTSKKINQSKKVSDERLGDSLDTSTRTSDSNEESDSASKNIIEITAVIGELSSDTSSELKSPVTKDPYTSDAIPEVADKISKPTVCLDRNLESSTEHDSTEIPSKSYALDPSICQQFIDNESTLNVMISSRKNVVQDNAENTEFTISSGITWGTKYNQ
ncbi:hypothetical protein GE061_013858 [Apolygus lucorum]|uniref:Uncharacterized protein n=1 Tax=Apolygus lucorum TaxID=248454 RepID=A0A8S9XR73_APOLU|nr:hypothetical protein GE061_013858 [Apolygus lucorum]